METKVSKVWPVELRTHGLFRLKHSFKKSKRRVCLEVQRKKTPQLQGLTIPKYEFDSDLDDEDIVILKVLRQLRKGEVSTAYQDKFSDDIHSLFDDDQSMTTIEANDTTNNDWVTRYIMRAQDLEIIKQQRNTCSVTYFSSTMSKKLDLVFETTNEAISFVKCIKQVKMAIYTRSHKNIQGLDLRKQRDRTYRLEVLSACGLRSANKFMGRSNPYCKVRIGQKDVHCTNVIHNTIEPVWATSTGSFVSFSATTEELLMHGLTFEVMNKEKLSYDSCLGKVTISMKDMFQSSNEIIELALVQDNSKYHEQGMLFVRCFETSVEKSSSTVEINESINESILSSRRISPKIEEYYEPSHHSMTAISWDTSLKEHRKGRIGLVVETRKPILVPVRSIFEMMYNGELPDDTIIWLRLFSLPRKKTDNPQNHINISTISQDTDDWLPTFSIRLQDIIIVKQYRNEITLKNLSCCSSEYHTLIFDSVDTAQVFSNTIAHVKSTRWKEKEEYAELKESTDRNTEVFLLEIISVSNMRSTDAENETFDPYCTVRIGENEIHRTKEVHSARPIWTFTTGSLALFSATTYELLEYGLTFEIFGSQRMGKGINLGQAHMPGRDILSSLDNEVDLVLDSKDVACSHWSKLTVRIRKATDDDVNFMERKKEYFHYKIWDERDLQNPSDFLLPANVKSGNPFSTTKFINKKPRKNSEILYRVTPYPDPSRPKETKWMTFEDIDNASKQPSTSWIETGSGKLGHLFVEIIGCDNLRESSLSKVDKIDPFVTLVYEGTAVSSEVVKNSKHPRFMPWTRRAFMFNMHHGQSHLFVGVFDLQKTSLIKDTPIGRLTIDLQNFQPGIEYFLHYDLYHSARLYPRGCTGNITVRLSMEYNQKALFWTSLIPYIPYQINTETANDIQLIKYAVEGKPDVSVYSHSILLSYLDEIAFFISALMDIVASILNVILWRPSHAICVRKTSAIYIPLNSIILFIGGVVSVEKPFLIPSLLLSLVAWIMLISLKNQPRNVPPWQHRPSPFWDMFHISIMDISSQQLHFYSETYEDVAPEEKMSSKTPTIIKLTARLVELRNYFKDYLDLGSREYIRENTGKKIDISLSLSVYRYLLEPFQHALEKVTVPIRILSKIITWKNYFVAYMITVSSILLSLVFIFVPWAFLFAWTMRLGVWLLLGPWMKLVDLYFIARKREPPKMVRERIQQARRRVEKLEEKDTKFRDYKQYLFGKWFYTMPNFIQPERYTDRPLPSSCAKPFPEGKIMSKEINLVARLYDQALNVDMIPEKLNE